MKRKESIIKKSHMTVLLLLLIVGIGIGFAALQTQLVINGNTTIDKVTWDVRFTNLQPKQGNSEGTVNLDEKELKVTYTATLAEPGDYFEFDVDVINKGSIDAVLSSIENDMNLSTEEEKYIVYDVTGIPQQNTILKKNNGTYTIHVKVQYNPEITADELPDAQKTFSRTIKLNYVQLKNSNIIGIDPDDQD